MILNNCNDFSDSLINSVGILCYIIIFVCIIYLFISIKNKKIFNHRYNKYVLIFGCGMFLLSLLFLLFTYFQNYNGCTCAYNDYKPIGTIQTYHGKIKDISLNKAIVIGDSRMELIERDKKELDIPINFSFIALSGSDIYWFEDYAMKELNNKLLNKNKDYKYHVIINMGVNDLQDDINISSRVSDYFKLYKELSLKYPDVNFYILSVNPIDENRIYKRWKRNIRTNNKILKFNNDMKKLVSNTESNNLYNCDSYNSLNFVLPDGLHFDHDTDQKILNYISNKCLRYE